MSSLPPNPSFPPAEEQPTSATGESTGASAVLLQQLANGASWFYWIGVLSMVNYLLIAFGANISFIVGLGVSTIAGAVAQAAAEQGREAATVFKVLGFVVTMGAAGVFLAFGVFANKRHLWAFVLGMGLYACDGLLLVPFKDLMGIGFHCFVLFWLFGGFNAARQLNAADRAAKNALWQPPAPR